MELILKEISSFFRVGTWRCHLIEGVLMTVALDKILEASWTILVAYLPLHAVWTRKGKM